MMIYLDGRFISETEACIPISDRGLLCGDGAFATVMVKDGLPWFLQYHLTRLEAQCRKFRLMCPYIDPDWIYHLISLNQAQAGIWKLKIVITGGDLPDMRLPEREGRILIFMKPYVPVPRKPLHMGIFSIPFYLCHASFKSLAHLNRFYVMEEAFQHGKDDSITLTENKLVLEAAFGNLIWFKEGIFYTPSPELPLYFGVTISQLLKAVQNLGYQTERVKIPIDELPADGIYFRTNTMGGITPIASIEERKYFLDEGLESEIKQSFYDLAMEDSQTLFSRS